LFFLESDKTKGLLLPEIAFHAFWRGDDLFDLSEINMEPKGIKVRDGRQTINIKIL
jgi:hypothetical protein